LIERINELRAQGQEDKAELKTEIASTKKHMYAFNFTLARCLAGDLTWLLGVIKH
jgi:hypothetical protein